MTRRLPFTREPWNFLMRAGCIGVYAAGFSGAAGLLPRPFAAPAVGIALFVLGAHTIELAVLRRHLGLYQGPAAKSVALALLFGSLHWFPLLELQRTREPPA
ncbi:MAG: hypothetical protein HY854_22350 [Burkholderiales bacterium]|nr:hypothetical protein [Burkholderiales bacterium]